MELLKCILLSIFFLALGVAVIGGAMYGLFLLIHIGLWYLAIGSLIIVAGIGLGISIYKS